MEEQPLILGGFVRDGGLRIPGVPNERADHRGAAEEACLPFVAAEIAHFRAVVVVLVKPDVEEILAGKFESDVECPADSDRLFQIEQLEVINVRAALL